MPAVTVATSVVDRITISGTERVDSTSSDGVTETLIHVNDPNALIQTIGYLKFAADGQSSVFYRGETIHWSSLKPSGFRAKSPAGMISFSTQMYQYIDEVFDGTCGCRRVHGKPACRSTWPCPDIASSVRGLVGKTPRAIVEPLLQQYGLRSRWLDLVDNIWIALWFGCHNLITDGTQQYAHHVRRSTASEPDGFAYVRVVDAGELESTNVAGVFLSTATKVVDLRRALPSVYVRPHAQHGLLLASRDWGPQAEPDLCHRCVATVRIHLHDALEWLGGGLFTTPYVLFPPPTRDEGYRRLIDYAPKAGPALGKVLIHGSGV